MICSISGRVALAFSPSTVTSPARGASHRCSSPCAGLRIRRWSGRSPARRNPCGAGTPAHRHQLVLARLMPGAHDLVVEERRRDLHVDARAVAGLAIGITAPRCQTAFSALIPFSTTLRDGLPSIDTTSPRRRRNAPPPRNRARFRPSTRAWRPRRRPSHVIPFWSWHVSLDVTILRLPFGAGLRSVIAGQRHVGRAPV
jgi:hypothetical protein